MAKTDKGEENTGKRIIAEWVGSEGSPRVDGHTARIIHKSVAKDAWEINISGDLHWGPHKFRLNISDEPPELREMLEKEGEFKITEQDG